MCACLCEEDLLRFLDGELGAQDDAPIVVHVEKCAGCQDRLERLTSGMPAPGRNVVRVDADPSCAESRIPRAGSRAVGIDPVGEDTCRATGVRSGSSPDDRPRQNPRATRKLDDTVDEAEGDDRQDPVRVEDPSQRVPERADPQGRDERAAPPESCGRGHAAAGDRPGLRDPRAPGRGRDGRRLQGAAPGPEPAGRLEDDPRREPGSARLLHSVPRRGRGGRAAAASQHHPDLRHRRGGRLAVRRAGAARRRQPRRSARRASRSRAGRPPSSW